MSWPVLIAVLLLSAHACGAQKADDAAWSKAVTAMCESPDFKTCQFMSLKEDETVFGNSGYLDGGTAYRGHKGIAVDFKEGHVQKVDMREYPNGKVGPTGNYVLARVPLSLACKGRVMVKAVFKPLSNPSGKQSLNCAEAKIFPDSSDTTPTVRCELELPSGPGSEEARAVKAKEAKCYLCNSCSKGGGCPEAMGKWYSDTFVVTRGSACDEVKSGKVKGYSDLFAQRDSYVTATFYNEYLLPKLAACSSPSCGFDAAYEDAKLKSALKCNPQGCP